MYNMLQYKFTMLQLEKYNNIVWFRYIDTS